MIVAEVIDRAVKRIKEYKKNLLKKGVVICPIRVALSETNSIAEFWQKISNEVTVEFGVNLSGNIVLLMLQLHHKSKNFPEVI